MGTIHTNVTTVLCSVKSQHNSVKLSQGGVHTGQCCVSVYRPNIQYTADVLCDKIRTLPLYH